MKKQREKLSRDKKRELAEQLYVYNDMSQKEIAEYVGVTEKTIGSWKDKDNWEHQKQALTLTRDEIIRNLYEQASLITKTAREQQRPLEPKEVDSIVKIATSIEKLDRKINLQVIIPVFKDFNIFLLEANSDLAKAITEYQRSYILKKAGGNGR